MQKEADGSHEERMPSPKQSKKIENEKNRWHPRRTITKHDEPHGLRGGENVLSCFPTSLHTFSAYEHPDTCDIKYKRHHSEDKGNNAGWFHSMARMGYSFSSRSYHYRFSPYTRLQLPLQYRDVFPGYSNNHQTRHITYKPQTYPLAGWPSRKTKAYI
jgi:hypothetical protein